MSPRYDTSSAAYSSCSRVSGRFDQSVRVWPFGGDLSVEYRGHDALAGQIDRLQVLARGVNHFARGRRGQDGHQWIEAADPQRVDTPDLAAGRQLQQAELGKERAFPEEFGIDSDQSLRLERPRQGRQLIVSIYPNRIGHTIDPRVQFRMGL